VFVGRSESPLGPFVDRDGQSFMAGRVGGTPALTLNGNRWVGPGHNTVFQDFDGQWWTFYHAIDQHDPWIEGPPFRINKRPVLLDPIDWVGGWPTVRGGQWASDEPMHRPAAQPGQSTRYKAFGPVAHNARQVLDEDGFGGDELDDGWSWVREPGSETWSVDSGVLRWETQAADLFEGNNSASVLTRDLPDGNWLIETRVKLDLPAEGCCFNFVQAGLLVYGGDDAYLKLVHVSIWETRQIEWAKEIPTPIVTGQRYGNTVVSAPNEWTWLRIASWTRGGERLYQAYTSRDGENWTRGGVWTHDLADARLGLVSMGGSGFTAEFDYVRVHRLQVQGSKPLR
jgi:arabinan endo-1,5-alpha-L-arabinosidase